MKTVVIAFLMSLLLLSCGQGEHGKDNQPHDASETGTNEPEGVVSGGPNGGVETTPVASDTMQKDPTHDATRKLPSPSERKEVTPPEVTKPNKKQ